MPTDPVQQLKESPHDGYLRNIGHAIDLLNEASGAIYRAEQLQPFIVGCSDDATAGIHAIIRGCMDVAESERKAVRHHER